MSTNRDFNSTRSLDFIESQKGQKKFVNPILFAYNRNDEPDLIAVPSSAPLDRRTTHANAPPT